MADRFSTGPPRLAFGRPTRTAGGGVTGGPSLDESRVELLAAELSGPLLRPGDDAYEDARRVHNGLVDKRPALIARCRRAADVAAAVRFGREAGLEISVRGGGHNVGGRAVTDGGLMIDLAEMKVVDVDPEARTVRAQGGVTWGELNRAAAVHDLAVTGGLVSTTGVAGLTLGGGLGWLAGVHGFAADNLLSVELVTAEGEILNVTADSHPDLFWALKGGGGNFGVASSLELRLHPLRQVVAGIVAHPFERAADVLRFYREFTRELPDELGVIVGLVHAPDGSGAKLAALVVCHAGDPEQAERDLAPLLAFGEPVLTQVGPMPYPDSNTLLDDAYPRGALNYWKSSFVERYDDGLVPALTEAFAATPSTMTAIAVECFHGAATRVPVEASPVPHRSEGYSVLITSVWTDPPETEANVEWTRRAYDALEPYRAPRRWLNYLVDDDGSDAVRAAYGPNYERLLEVKRRYDPHNVFRLNHNIDPAG